MIQVCQQPKGYQRWTTLWKSYDLQYRVSLGLGDEIPLQNTRS